MIDDLTPVPEPAIWVLDEALVKESPKTRFFPWVTCLVIFVSLVIFLKFSQEDLEDWEVLMRYGVLPPDAIWDGGYWSLVASAFVHHEFWHFGLNAFWLWRLGSRLEIVMGSWLYVLFLLASAFVSSSFQLAASDTTGIGASGMGYAIFGLMWTTRSQHPRFQEVLDHKTIQCFFFWLVACTVLTTLKVWDVGNAAHISGLLFGCAIGNVWASQTQRTINLARPIVLLVLSIIPLFWCPWSTAWLGHQAYRAHVANRMEDALAWYTRLLAREPKNAWAIYNRGIAYEALGQPALAQAEFQRAREIDPSIVQPTDELK